MDKGSPQQAIDRAEQFIQLHYCHIRDTRKEIDKLYANIAEHQRQINLCRESMKAARMADETED